MVKLVGTKSEDIPGCLQFRCSKHMRCGGKEKDQKRTEAPICYHKKLIKEEGIGYGTTLPLCVEGESFSYVGNEIDIEVEYKEIPKQNGSTRELGIVTTKEPEQEQYMFSN
ncbi:MAG: hypothetical protein GOV02_00385 [Candidatus Aenigmarchaeota archaeon]|nr:hypothetical protein [Candidatus Aenigmarchaeota archaeon]